MHVIMTDLPDSNILHVNGEVGQNGERGPIEEKQSEFQGKEIHVRIKKFLGI